MNPRSHIARAVALVVPAVVAALAALAAIASSACVDGVTPDCAAPNVECGILDASAAGDGRVDAGDASSDAASDAGDARSSDAAREGH